MSSKPSRLCCFPLETGVKFVGYLCMVLFGLYTIVNVYNILDVVKTKEDEEFDEKFDNTWDEYFPPKNNIWKYYPNAINTVQLLLHPLLTVFSLMLVIAINRVSEI